MSTNDKDKIIEHLIKDNEAFCDVDLKEEIEEFLNFIKIDCKFYYEEQLNLYYIKRV